MAGRRTAHTGGVIGEAAQVQRRERAKAIVSISCIALLSFACVYVAYYALPTDPDSPLYHLVPAILMRYIIPVAALAVVYTLRFRLSTVPSVPSEVLSKLAHQLRASGMRVKGERSGIAVQASSLAEVKITAKATQNGTLVTYAPYATPTGWAVVLVFVLLFAWVSLAASLYILYTSAVFSGGRVYPHLSGSPRHEAGVAGDDTQALLIDGLSEAHRLSAESYEAARSDYHDFVLVLVTVGLAVSTISALVTGIYLPDNFADGTRALISICTGAAVGAPVLLISWRAAAAKLKPRIEDLMRWSSRLETALAREIEAKPPLDSEPSSFELLADASRQLPSWLKARERAGMFRESGYWMTIAMLMYAAFSMASGGGIALLRDNLAGGVLLLSLSPVLGILAVFLYLRWKGFKAKEEAAIASEWTTRVASLGAEMEKYLGGVRL